VGCGGLGRLQAWGPDYSLDMSCEWSKGSKMVITSEPLKDGQPAYVPLFDADGAPTRPPAASNGAASSSKSRDRNGNGNGSDWGGNGSSCQSMNDVRGLVVEGGNDLRRCCSMRNMPGLCCI
jgi:hypothetical protein